MIKKIVYSLVSKLLVFDYTYVGLTKSLFHQCSKIHTGKKVKWASLGVWFDKYVFPQLPISSRIDYQSQAMGGEEAVDWAIYYEKEIENYPPKEGSLKIGGLDYYQALPYLEVVKSKLNSGSFRKCMQIGCSSGREINYFASLFPCIQFIGAEIDSQIVEYLNNSYKNQENLSFVVSWAGETAKEQALDDTLVFSNGSLQYVYPEHLDMFFKAVAGISNVCLVFSEPTNFKKICPTKVSGSLPRGKLSYTHNYEFYAGKAEMRVEKVKITKPYDLASQSHGYTANYLGIFLSEKSS